MKRVLLAIFSFIYLGIASGMVVNIHYCMGRQSAIQLSNHSGNQCNNCGMKNDGGCCRDEYKLVKLEVDQQLVKSHAPSFDNEPSIIPSFAHQVNQNVQGCDLPLSLQYHSPPDMRASQVFQFNCNFRI